MPSSGFLLWPSNRTALSVSQNQAESSYQDNVSVSKESNLLSKSDRMTDPKEFSDRKLFTSMFKRFAQEPEEPLPPNRISKRYSKSHIEELSPDPPQLQVNLKDLSIFIDNNNRLDTFRDETSNSPSKITRRQLTQEFDRDQSPRRIQKERKGTINEKFFFDENEGQSGEYPRMRSECELQDNPADPQNRNIIRDKIKKSSQLQEDAGSQEQLTRSLEESCSLPSKKAEQKASLANNNENSKSGPQPTWIRKQNSFSTALSHQDMDSIRSIVCFT